MPKITYRCDYCKKENTKYSWELRHKYRYCDTSCWAKDNKIKRTKKYKKPSKYGNYLFEYCPLRDKFMRVHRLVMERHLGRLLNKNEIVHHIDGNKTNNNISNLELMTNADHSRHHRLKK